MSDSRRNRQLAIGIWQCFLLLLLPALARGQTAPATRPLAPQRLAELGAQVQAQIARKDYAAAEQTCRAMVEIAPRFSIPHYNLACMLARQKKTEDAIAELTRALELGYGDPDAMAKDEDLLGLHEHAAWRDLVAKAKANAERMAPYDRGIDLPDLKTVKDAPEGGLRYRLRISPQATAEKPHRLIVWLHPSGGSANRLVEAMAPQFAARGYALLVPSQKNWGGWSNADAEALMNKTLPAAAEKTPAVDAKRPLLMGYSAGGQIALEIWYAKPALVGGLVLDAAYPVKIENRPYVLHEVPQDLAAAKQVPLFVLVGAKDGGLRFWQQAQKDWTELQKNITVHTVPGKGHAWLFDKERTDLLLTWLESLKKP